MKKVRVKSYVRRGKLVKQYDRSDKRKKKLAAVGIGAAATLGLSAIAFVALRNRYRTNIKQSAQEALKLAKNVKVSNLSYAELKRPNINFAVGGLS